MIARQIEHRRHLTLRLTCAHQRSIAAASKRKRKSVEHDGFAGAGLACEHGQPRPESEVEAINQDDVADRKLDEHGRDGSVSPCAAKGFSAPADRWSASISCIPRAARVA